MVLRLAYLTVTNTFIALGLLSTTDRDRDVEILAYVTRSLSLSARVDEKRQPARDLTGQRREGLGPQVHISLWCRCRGGTVLRWHHNLMRRRHAFDSRPKRPGHPSSVRSILTLALCLVRESPAGDRWIYGVPEEAGCQAQLLVQDRDGKRRAPLAEVLTIAGIWNERHLRHALRGYERLYNQNRAHQALGQSRPLRPVPGPITDPERVTPWTYADETGSGAHFHEYSHTARRAWMKFSAGPLQ